MNIYLITAYFSAMDWRQWDLYFVFLFYSEEH